MDPVTPNLIAGLIVEAIKGFGSRARKVDPAIRAELEQRAVGDPRKFLVSILSELESVSPDDSLLIGRFLRTPEFRSFARSIAVASMVRDPDLQHGGFVEKLSALLVLAESLPREPANRYARLLVETISTGSREALTILSNKDSAEYELVLRQAEAEHGRTLGAREHSQILNQMDSHQYAATLEFVDEYCRIAYAASGELVPAYFDTQRRVPIGALHVAPTFAMIDSTSQPLWSQLRSPTDTETTDLPGLIGRSYRVVVLGDPGAGKSTLAQRILHDLTAPLDDNAAIGRVPFVVTLRRYDEKKRHRGYSLIQYIEASLNENFHLSAPAGAIEYLFTTGRAIAVLDGLDELLETHLRREMVEAVENFGQKYSSAEMIVTSRKIGYPEAPLKTDVFKVAVLEEFDEYNVAEYAQKWFRLDDRLPRSERARITAAFIEESESVADIRSNPLMLGLLCNVYRGERSIPRNRAELYDQCARMLFEKWDASRGIGTANILRSDARAALQVAAASMFGASSRAEGLAENELVTLIADSWHGSRYESQEEARDAARSLLASWRGRAWVLTDVGLDVRGDSRYKFAHQTFLEYFAAEHIVRCNPTPDELWAVLEPHIARTEWEIVAQLAVQMSAQHNSRAADRIYDLVLTACHKTGRQEAHALLRFALEYCDVFLPSLDRVRRTVAAALDIYLAAPGTTVPAGSESSPVDDSLQLLKIAAGLREERISRVAIEEISVRCTQRLAAAEDRVARRALLVLGSRREFESLLEVEPGSLGEVDWHALKPVWGDRLVTWVRSSEEVALTAYENRLINGRSVTELVPLSALLEAAPRFGLKFPWRSPAVILFLRRYLTEFGPAWPSNNAARDMHQLGTTFGLLRSPFIPPSFHDHSGTSDLVIRQCTLGSPDWDEFVALRDQARQAIPFPAPTGPAAYSAAVILGSIIETERWDRKLSASPDVGSFLQLGPVQALEPLFVSRISNVAVRHVDRALRQFPFTTDQHRILAAWAAGDFDFVVRRRA